MIQMNPVDNAAKYKFSKNELENFKINGFIITPILFDESTLSPLREAFMQQWLKLQKDAESGDELTRDQAKHRPFLSLMTEAHPCCAEFCMHDVFKNIAMQLLGENADLTFNQAVIKPPNSGDNSFAWHQDNFYALNGPYAQDANVEMLKSPDSGFIAWTAISRTTVDNGTLWVLPGQHTDGLLPHRWSEDKREWQGIYDTSWKIPVVLHPGQILIFNKYLPHSSGCNKSSETRMAYQLGFSWPGLKKGPSRDVKPLIRR